MERKTVPLDGNLDAGRTRSVDLDIHRGIRGGLCSAVVLTVKMMMMTMYLLQLVHFQIHIYFSGACDPEGIACSFATNAGEERKR